MGRFDHRDKITYPYGFDARNTGKNCFELSTVGQVPAMNIFENPENGPKMTENHDF